MSDADAADQCGFPMWPGGPGCARESGHPVTDKSAHWGTRGDHLQWSYTACWKELPGDRRCVLRQGHTPTRTCYE